MDFHWWLKWTGLEKTRWLNDQSTPVLDDGRYRAALKGGLFQQREMFTEVDESGVICQMVQKRKLTPSYLPQDLDLTFRI
jgi:hypothetical protein